MMDTHTITHTHTHAHYMHTPQAHPRSTHATHTHHIANEKQGTRQTDAGTARHIISNDTHRHTSRRDETTTHAARHQSTEHSSSTHAHAAREIKITASRNLAIKGREAATRAMQEASRGNKGMRWGQQT